jgi:hypothetical protein
MIDLKLMLETAAKTCLQDCQFIDKTAPSMENPPSRLEDAREVDAEGHEDEVELDLSNA